MINFTKSMHLGNRVIHTQEKSFYEFEVKHKMVSIVTVGNAMNEADLLTHCDNICACMESLFSFHLSCEYEF